MKKVFYLLTFVVFVSGIAFASFPVKTSETSKSVEKSVVLKNGKSDITVNNLNTTVDQKFENNDVQTTTDSKQENNSNKGNDDTLILVLLWFFLGGLAAHRWYAGKPAGWNILFILTAGGCGIWALIDLIHILQGKF